MNRYAQIDIETSNAHQIKSILCSDEERNENKYVLVDENITEADWFCPLKGFMSAPTVDENGFIEKRRLVTDELSWQESELAKVDKAIYNYRQDQLIPETYSELRVTSYTEDDYYALLGDRKLLVEYIEQEDFPDCGRPMLSGLASTAKVQL